MDDDRKIEALLEALSPAPVPDPLELRIFAIFDGEASDSTEPEPGKVVPFPLWRRLGTAAAILIAGVGVFFAVLNSFGPSPSGEPIAEAEALIGPGAKSFQPVRAENVFEGVRDSGVFIGEDGAAVRELRFQFLDSYLWKNAEDGSELEMTVPRERRYLVPVRTD